MVLKRNRAWRVVGWVIAAMLLAAIGYIAGAGAGGGPGGFGAGEANMPQVAPIEDVAPSAADAYSGGGTSGRTADAAMDSEEGAPSASADQMVIRTAALEMRVEKIETAVGAVRKAAGRHQASIEQLTIDRGEGGVPYSDVDASSPSPAGAVAVLRVPAAKLQALSDDISKLGTVISESSSSDDVTQRHVDLSARLKNLKAEESRLRGFLNRTGKVSELLQVERELSRVRGEIESMQAQVDYLERQVARATLTVSLTEPGPIVQPGGADWGFAEAVRRGIQGAAAVLTTLISALIALAPLAVIALLGWLVARPFLRRGKASRDTADKVAPGTGVSSENVATEPADQDTKRP